jgi:hypothetical protein
VKRKETVKTICILAAALLLASFIFRAPALAALAALLLLTLAAGKRIPEFVARSWIAAGFFISSVITGLFLGIIFYCVLTPIALLYRRFNKEAVGYFKKRRAGTYYKDVNTEYGRQRFEKLW